MPTTIEQLELEVQSSSTSAVAGIDALSASLSKLKNAVRGGVGLTSVANQVRNLDTALKSMDSSGADKIDKLASSLEKLTVFLSFSTCDRKLAVTFNCCAISDCWSFCFVRKSFRIVPNDGIYIPL